ncbi:MAG TPA: c-type cytochrome [Tepidisphaeraceae bacterium]|jgi:mono/diheme cytochrome c family protein|nr:c-type cytochrome [Tepidisphaeraceae bacterium]
MRSCTTVCLGSVVLAVAVSGCSSGSEAVAPPGSQAADARGLTGAAARGKTVYVQNCSTCHGPGGKGDGPNAFQCTNPPSNLCEADIAERSRTALLRKISKGGSGMPSFERLLSEQDRSDVVEYVRTLSGRSANRQQEADSHF